MSGSLVRAFVLLGSLLVSGCGGGTASGEACAARVATMRDTFARIPQEVVTSVIWEDDRASDLVTSPQGEPPRLADVMIHVRASGEFHVDGHDVDLAGVKQFVDGELERRARLMAMRDGSPPSENPVGLQPAANDAFVGHDHERDVAPPAAISGAQIHLAVAPDAPLTELLRLLPELPADASVALLVRDPRPMPETAELPASVLTALRNLEAQEAASRANPRLSDDPPLISTMMTCSAFHPLTERMALAPAAEREAMWLQEAPTIALECGCDGVDVEGLAAITWLRLRPDLPLLRLLPLRWSAEARRVVLAHNARGVDLVRAVEASGAAPVNIALATP